VRIREPLPAVVVSGNPGSTRTRFDPAQCLKASLVSTVDRLSVTAIQDQRPRIVIGGLLPLPPRFEHPSAIIENRSIFTKRQSLREVMECRAEVATPESNDSAICPWIGQKRVRFYGPRECIGRGVVMTVPQLDQPLPARRDALRSLGG
jgi:hypothetical protein